MLLTLVHKDKDDVVKRPRALMAYGLGEHFGYDRRGVRGVPFRRPSIRCGWLVHIVDTIPNLFKQKRDH